MTRKALTEEDKINIIHKVHTLGTKWTCIGKLLEINPQTCRSFYNSYLHHHTIVPKRGRPSKLNDDLRHGVIGATEDDPKLSLRDLGDLFYISIASAKKVLNEDGIKFHPLIPVPPLTKLRV